VLNDLFLGSRNFLLRELRLFLVSHLLTSSPVCRVTQWRTS